LTVNPMDGSCWVGDSESDEVTHLASDGTTLWARGGFSQPGGVAVHFRDGSAWTADTGNGQLAHLALAGYPSTRVRFWDVPFAQWAEPQIRACADAGVVAGYPNGSYVPSGTVTRDQMSVYVSRALAGGDAKVPAGPAKASFPDVLTGHWAYRYVEYAKSRNVVGGHPDGSYQPANAVDRGQMAAYIARALVAPGGDQAIPDPTGSATFVDVPAGFWAFKHVEYCKAQQIVKGFPDGLYHPEIVVTRDQMAVYVQRAFGLAT